MDLAKLKMLYNSVEDKKSFFAATGISASAFHYILKGVTSPTANTIVKIAEYFSIPCGALFKDYDRYKNNATIANNNRKYQHTLVLKDALIFYND